MLRFEKLYNKEWLREYIINLYNIEKYQSSSAHKKAADYVYTLLKDQGFEAEIINIPSDGKTVYQDKRTSIGWDVSDMYIKLVNPIEGIDDGIIASYKKNQCSVAKHSCSTPPGGITTRLITEDAMHSGVCVKNSFVLLNRGSRPSGAKLTEILNNGAIGYVSDIGVSPGEDKENTIWLNSGTETGSWDVCAGERDFIGFLVSAHTADALRKACAVDGIDVYAYSDGVRCEAVRPVVSGLLPGENKKEIWVMAHMYEPLIDDNSNGVIGSVAMLMAIRKLARDGCINLKYSIRVVFASEVYGFAAACEHYGGRLSERCLAGINMDGLPGSVEKGRYRSWRAFEAPENPGDASNLFLHWVMDTATELYPEYAFNLLPSSYGDDQALSDFTIGLPTVWFLRDTYNCYHHNSILNEKYIDIDVFTDTLVLSSSWVCAMASFGSEEIKNRLPRIVQRANEFLKKSSGSRLSPGCNIKKREEFLLNREKHRILSLKKWADIPEILTASNKLTYPEGSYSFDEADKSIYAEAEKYVFKRKTRGLPMDMTAFGKNEKQYFRGLFIYYPIAELFSRMDGKKNLRELTDEYNWDKNTVLPGETLEKYIDICLSFCKNGYLELVK